MTMEEYPCMFSNFDRSDSIIEPLPKEKNPAKCGILLKIVRSQL